LNKAKLTYDNKYDYYEIQKPLLIIDMLYTKKIYDNKLEYPIALEHVNNGKYFFEIEDDFSEIILDQVEFLNLLKKKKRMNMNPKRKKKMKKKKKKQESKTIQFLGVIVNYTLCEKNENNKNYYIIWSYL